MVAYSTFDPVIGIIYPGHAAEDDYPLAEQFFEYTVRLPVEHIYGTDLHAVTELLDLGSPQRLASGAALLMPHHPHAILWACTSGSFVYGWDEARRQILELSDTAQGLPTSSTSFAFVHAAQALGVQRVAVAASYPADVATLFVEFLRHGGIEVVSLSSANIKTAEEVGQLPVHRVVDLIASHDHPDAQALLVPDTAMRTLALIESVEERLGKPVLTANQVTVWEGLRLVEKARNLPKLGMVFSKTLRSE